ncbi:MAG: TIGR02452 family protein [Chlamydiae bacterium]|nr:TIGR02452 family protein [Chlamydiota bacterium]
MPATPSALKLDDISQKLKKIAPTIFNVLGIIGLMAAMSLYFLNPAMLTTTVILGAIGISALAIGYILKRRESSQVESPTEKKIEEAPKEKVPNDIEKIALIKRKQKEDLKRLKEVVEKEGLPKIAAGAEHFDWWMFPIDRQSKTYDNLYQLSESEINILMKNDEFMDSYRQGIKLVATAWGWDVEKGKTLKPGQWSGYDIRLFKMALSLYLFKEHRLLKNLLKCVQQEPTINFTELLNYMGSHKQKVMEFATREGLITADKEKVPEKHSPTHDSQKWQNEFNLSNPDVKRKLRKNIFDQNEQMKTHQHYITEKGNKVDVKHTCNPSFIKKNPNDDLKIKHPQIPVHSLTLKVLNMDSLEASELLQKKGYKTAVLNMANATHPGGGYATGAGAQEESIHRQCPTLDLGQASTLEKMGGNYHIPDEGCLVTLEVPQLRDSEAKGYRLREEAEIVTHDIISAAAINLQNRDEPIRKISKREIALTKQKIRSILRAAIDSGHNAIVLSAFGCGAFKNDPNDMAVFFSDVLNEKHPTLGKKYNELIKPVFAIIGDHNDVKGNFKVFKSVLAPSE